jgi:lysophospholipase L1-like esterase
MGKFPLNAGSVALMVATTLVVSSFATLVYQGKRRPTLPAQYVALGSSFAAGLGLGARAPASPVACFRSINGYPRQLARLRALSLVDMTCSGATSRHVLRGGQYFQGPQLDGVHVDTELITLTIGGNDVGYVGDLALMAHRTQNSVVRWLLNRFWHGPQPVEKRNFSELYEDLRTILQEIARRAPRAMVIVVTYPAILPPAGTCSKLQIDFAEAALMRAVADRLAEVTRAAARQAGAIVVDMATLSVGHDACAEVPWVNGATPSNGAPFHPTQAGAEATAREINRAIDLTP